MEYFGALYIDNLAATTAYQPTYHLGLCAIIVILWLQNKFSLPLGLEKSSLRSYFIFSKHPLVGADSAVMF
jgi:hypothetical protein